MLTIKVNKGLHGSSGDMELDVDLEIKENDFIAISGESGSGKTTLLRIIAGLEEANGEIIVGEEEWLKEKNSLAIQKRNIGFVFQDYALFNNMSVEKNLLYVKKDKELANHLMEIAGILELKDRMPTMLSGGQKQRVSLCRALMNRPKLLIMDEPLSALDPSIRLKLRDAIFRLHKEFKMTTIMVTHDTSEIYSLANRVIVMENGKVINSGTPKEVFSTGETEGVISMQGEVLDIVEKDNDYMAIVCVQQQIIEVLLKEDEKKSIKVGECVELITKRFSTSIKKY